jgi:hypothetical protein
MAKMGEKATATGTVNCAAAQMNVASLTQLLNPTLLARYVLTI